MNADTDIQNAAQKLIERYGDNALSVAEERIAALSKANDQSRAPRPVSVRNSA